MSDKKIVIKNQKGENYVVPPGGSLGLLALGNVGVRAWKKARKDWESTQNQKLEKE
jgi:hypothetical protein